MPEHCLLPLGVHWSEQQAADDSQPFAMLPSQLYQPLEHVQVGVQEPHTPLVQVGVQLPVVWDAVHDDAWHVPQLWDTLQTVWVPQLKPRLAQVSVQGPGWDVHTPFPSHLQLPPVQPVEPVHPVSVEPAVTWDSPQTPPVQVGV